MDETMHSVDGVRDENLESGLREIIDQYSGESDFNMIAAKASDGSIVISVSGDDYFIEKRMGGFFSRLSGVYEEVGYKAIEGYLNGEGRIIVIDRI